MNPAVIVIDVLKDTVDLNPMSQLARETKKIIPKIQQLLSVARKHKIPIVFACDSFRSDDFIFEGKGKPICLEGTDGSEIVEDLQPLEGEIIIRKRRFSGFFRTDLDLALRKKKIDTIILCGVTTQFCVLATAFDGIQSDFNVILVEDCIACHSMNLHNMLMEAYKNTILYPLLRVSNLIGVVEEFEKN